MSGQLGDLSSKQASTLAQLKTNISDVMKPHFDDEYLLRWLRARRFDLKKSEKMLRDSIEWRKKQKIDTLLDDWTVPEVLQNYYPGGYYGHDKQGNPNWIDCLGTVDLKGMLFSATKRDIVRYKVWGMELLYQRMLPESSKKFGRRINHCNLIFDMDGIGMKHLWKPAIDTFTEILSVFEANYPETLLTCWVVNTPAIFPVAYNLVNSFLSDDTREKVEILGTPIIFPIAYNLAKPFLSEDTKKKIRVCGRNWREVLLKDIDADQLPKHWGGTATDPDGEPHCKSKICIGGEIPEKFHKLTLENVDISNFKSVTVARGSFQQLEFDVNEAQCILRWQFQTEGMDIGFGVFRKKSKDQTKVTDMDEVLSAERVNSHLVPEEGSVTCQDSGTYVVLFDNSYSWVNSKKVLYSVEVLNPDHSDELVKVSETTAL